MSDSRLPHAYSLQNRNQVLYCRAMIARQIEPLVRKRLDAYPAVALIGPRQSGKTTLARSMDGVYFDLEQEPERLRLDLEWDRVVDGRELVVLDEAQSWPEVFVRLRRPDHGRFWFVEGVKTRAYGTEAHHRFSVDDVLDASDARREEWRSIEPLVPDGATEFRLRPRLRDGEGDVEIASRDWEVLAAIGSGATVQDVAERMGVFEYSAARLTADLVERGLLVTAQHAEEIDREPRTVLLTVLPELADDQGAPTPVGPPA